jgi:hypothetical protein
MRPRIRPRPWLPLLAVAVAGGCASAPPLPPVVDESAQQVAEQWGKSFRMRWQFLLEDRRYGLGSVRGVGSGTAANRTVHLVFIDGRLACTAPNDVADLDWYWASQADGLTYLAGRMLNACGRGEAVPPRGLHDASAVVPVGLIKVDELPEADETFSFGKAVGGSLLGSLVVFGSFVLSPIAVGALPVIAASSASVEGKRAQVTLDMPWVEAQPILGTPDITFLLPAASTDVHGYLVTATTMHTAGQWYVGVRDGRVLWLSGSDEWLDALAETIFEQQK